MRQKDKQIFYEKQYAKGETAGPVWYQALSSFTTTREDVAIKLLQKQKTYGKILLDLGCGEGYLLRKLSLNFKQLIGTDIARNRIKLARKKSKKNKNIIYKIADLDLPLPFNSKSIDAVTCLSVMEYVFDPNSFIKEVHRVLKKNGLLIISVPNLAYLPERIKLLFGILPSWPDAIGWQGGRLHTFTFKSLTNLLEENDFKVIRKTGSGFLQPVRNLWPEILSGDCHILARKK